MKIDHIALWVRDMDKTRAFYLKYFDCSAGERYENPTKGFSSFFIRFADGSRIELMHRNDITSGQATDTFGWAHIAIAIGTPGEVNALTTKMQRDGIEVASLPRRTGDGYYESVVFDPEGNRLELVASPHFE
jgi:lactoylglutathione lyase